MSAPPPPDPVIVLNTSEAVTSLTVDDRGVLFSGHLNGRIREWNTQTQRTKSSWTGHSDTVISISCPEQNFLIISQGREGQVKVWTNTGDQACWTLSRQISSAKLIFCNSTVLNFKDSICLAMPCDQTAIIQVIELSTSVNSSNATKLRVVSTLEPPSVKDYGMCMKMCSPAKSGGKLLVGYESGVVALWDGESGVCLAQSKVHDESVMCLDGIVLEANPDSATIVGVSGSADKSIHKWTIRNGEIIKCQTVNTTNPGFCDIKIRQDGRIFVSGGWDSAGRVFTLKRLRPLAVLTYHKQSVQCVCFTGERMIATGSKDGYIALWDVYKDT